MAKHSRTYGSHQVLCGILNLDDLGPHGNEPRSGVGSGPKLSEIHDPEARQRSNCCAGEALSDQPENSETGVMGRSW